MPVRHAGISDVSAAKIPLFDVRRRNLAQPPFVEVLLVVPRARLAANHDRLVPLWELLFRLLERVFRLAVDLRHVNAGIIGHVPVQLANRSGMRIESERAHDAAVLRLAADKAEPLVYALVLGLLDGRRVAVPHQVGERVFQRLHLHLRVRVKAHRLVEHVVQVDVVAAHDDVLRHRVRAVAVECRSARAVEESVQAFVIHAIEVEDHGAHFRLPVGGVGLAPVGQAVEDGPIGLLELGQSVLEGVL